MAIQAYLSPFVHNTFLRRCVAMVMSLEHITIHSKNQDIMFESIVLG